MTLLGFEDGGTGVEGEVAGAELTLDSWLDVVRKLVEEEAVVAIS